MPSKMTGILKFIILGIIPNLVWGQSLTIVLDTTMSMQEDIDVIKSNLRSVVDAARFMPHINEFVLVPFSDPNVGDPLTTKSPEEFLRAVNAIKTSGGTDCPENSLAGIRKALEISKPESYIYVFTDAFAKDYNHVSVVKDLCKTTRSKVIIFLSGYCVTREGTADIYKNITQHCSGAVFQLGLSNYRKAFQYMKEMTAVEWNNVQSYSPIADRFEFQVSLNSFSSNMIIVATGKQASVIVKDCDNCEDIMKDAKSFHVIRVKPHVGTYSATLRCETCSSLVVYERLSLQFEYGFSPRPVKNIKETSLKPIPDAQNYITIFLTNVESVKVTSMELQSRRMVSHLQLEEVGGRPGCYTATEYIDAKERYRLIINGYDYSTSQQLSGSTRILEPQKTGFAPASMAPIVEIIEPENTLVEFEASISVPCRVTAYPRPDIWWEDVNEQKLSSEEILLETPAVFMSYVTVDSIVANTTINCKAKNYDGQASQELNLYVNRTAVLEFVEEPKDESFAYGSRGSLFCKVESYPAAIIKWYHNDTMLDNSDNIEIDGDNTVVIQQMGLDDTGEYKCEASNTVETKSSSAVISVSGLVYPEVSVDENEIAISPGERECIDCRIVSGHPYPNVTWLYKSDNMDDFGNIPSDAYIEEPGLCTMTAGIYKCIGSNILGEDYKEVVVKIKSPPKILKGDDETVTVKYKSRIELPCEVESASSTTVRWEISQGDVLVPLGERHHINSKNTLRFSAMRNDSGNYHCIAENEFGRADKTYNVVVQERPYIQAPFSRAITASVGSTVRLSCIVMYGNPPSSTRWEFYSPDSPPTTISRGHATNVLTLENISKAHEGSYTCIANNAAGFDSIKIVVNVQ